MIKYEDYGLNRRGKELVRAYSDQGFYIERDGETYVEAIDLKKFNYKYTETNQKIEAEKIARETTIIKE